MSAERAFPLHDNTTWTEAADRVEAYLRAHRVTHPRLLARLTADIISLARHRAKPGEAPLKVAVETMDACLAGWLAPLLAGGETSATPDLPRARLALAMGEMPKRWPEFFLRDGSAPPEMARALREAGLGRGPAIHFSNMAPRLPVGLANARGRAKWQLTYRWPFFRIVAGLVIVLSVLGVTLTVAL